MANANSGQPDDSITRDTPLPGKDNAPAQINLVREQPPRQSYNSVSSFSAGELLAGRFKVVRFVARGGMGEVYEAEDLELKERVALKTVRFEIAHEERTIERFKREIQLARKVAHTNVCRTFDVFRHAGMNADGEKRETLLVSMELLAGETLECRIKRCGRLSPTEALSILNQMAAGLNSAHRAGVIHRDFKSSNVMLVPSDQGPGGTRVVVMDFGLAHASVSTAPSLTRTLDFLGTPAFMAPEQLEGGDITPATDIYALGVVMYEMLTGALPFTGETPLAGALKRLSERAPSPRVLVPQLDAKWEQAVLRCLERAPADRFASTEDVANAVRGEGISTPWRWPPILRGAGRHWLAATIILLLLGTASYVGVRYLPRPAPPPKRPSVAVLGFRNLSGQESLNALGDELAENLGSQLDTDEIHFISRGRVEDMKHNLDFQNVSESVSPDTLRKIHELLGCDYVVVGSYAAEGGSANPNIQWNIHLEKTSDGESLGTVAKTMLWSDRFKVVRDAGVLVRKELGVNLPPSEEARVSGAMPFSSEASSYYSQGVEKLRNFDALAATKLLAKAIKVEPDFAPAHSELAEAWSILGYESKAREEAKKAFDLSSGLSQETGGLIKARFYEMTQDWDKAGSMYSSLMNIFDQNPEYGLRLARAQVSAGKGKDALVTLNQMRSLNPPKGIQAQIDLLESKAQQDLGNFQEQLNSSNAAAEKAKSLGAKLLLARARIPQCLALLNLGKPDDAKPLCEDAKTLNQGVGDQLGTARAINAIANAYYGQGNFVQAWPLYEEALRISRTIGDKLDESGALTNLGIIRMAQGDLAGAIKAHEESIIVARDRGDKNGMALAQQNLAAVLYTQGDRVKAKDMFERSVKLAKDTGAKDIEARALNNLCMISGDSGELRKALVDCNASLELRQGIGDKNGMARSLVNIGDILLAQGDLAGSRQSYEQALTIQEKIQSKDDAAYTRASIAALALEEKEPAVARDLARSAAQELRQEKDTDGEAQARAILAKACLESGDPAEATKQIEQASHLAEKSGDRSLKLQIAVISGAIDAKSGQTEQALKTLEAARKQARASGLVGIEFTARLAIGEAEIKSGQTKSGHALLSALAQEAKGKSFNLIAAKAARND